MITCTNTCTDWHNRPKHIRLPSEDNQPMNKMWMREIHTDTGLIVIIIKSLSIDESMFIIIYSCQWHVLVMVTVHCKTRRGRRGESTFRDKDVPSNDLMPSCANLCMDTQKSSTQKRSCITHFSGKVNEYQLHSLPLLSFFSLLTSLNPPPYLCYSISCWLVVNYCCLR